MITIIKYRWPLLISGLILFYGIIMFFIGSFLYTQDVICIPVYFKLMNTVSYLFNMHVAFIVFNFSDLLSTRSPENGSILFALAIIPVFGFFINWRLLIFFNIVSLKVIKRFKPDVEENDKLIALILIIVPVAAMALLLFWMSGNGK